MNRVQKLVNWVDRVQQDRPWLAFPVAVWKKFGDDQAGNLAALIAYYAFASLFPLLLVLVTAADIVLRSHPALRQHVLSSAFGQFPVVGTELAKNPHSLHETGPALIVGIVLTFLGARGVAGAVLNAMNTVWVVPMFRRPGFPWSLLRQVGLMLVVGIGLIASTILSGLAGNISFLHGAAAQVGAIVVSLVFNVGVFWLAFRLATANEIGARTMLPSAAVAAVIWQILQLLGTSLVHHLAGSSSVYGVFGIVIGLLAWLYLGAQLTLYAVEANVVAVRGLWPRSLAPPPLTHEDQRALNMYAKSQERRPEQEIESHIAPADPAQPAEPTQPAEPARPPERPQPAQPAESGRSPERVQPAQQAQPAEPAEPAEPAQPTQPGRS